MSKKMNVLMKGNVKEAKTRRKNCRLTDHGAWIKIGNSADCIVTNAYGISSRLSKWYILKTQCNNAH